MEALQKGDTTIFSEISTYLSYFLYILMISEIFETIESQREEKQKSTILEHLFFHFQNF